MVTILLIGAVAYSVLGSPGAAPRGGNHGDQVAAVRGLAAAWITGQLSRSAVISCDPVMCAALRTDGTPASDLRELTSSQGNPMRSAVIVATPSVRADLGSRLATVDAPAVIARFGSAASRIEIRAVAAHGAAAFRATLQADLTQRRESGIELLHSGRVLVSEKARRELAAGQVDARLLVNLAALAGLHPIDVVSFGDAGPGASLSVSPYRGAYVAQARSGQDPGFAPSVLSFLRSQRPPFATSLAQSVRLSGGRTVVRLQFTAPSPLGLLSGSAASQPGS